jgi:hypothetical protein
MTENVVLGTAKVIIGDFYNGDNQEEVLSIEDVEQFLAAVFDHGRLDEGDFNRMCAAKRRATKFSMLIAENT